MDALSRVFKFTIGSALGAALGVGFASVMAPQRGQDLQASTRGMLQEARMNGEEARVNTIQSLTEKYRLQTNDLGALTVERERNYANRK